MGLELRMQGLGSRVQGSGFKVQGSGCKAYSLGFRVWFRLVLIRARGFGKALN